MRRCPAPLAGLLLVVVMMLAGCSGGTSSAPQSTPADALPSATGGFGQRPTITFPDAEPPATLKTQVLSRGTGRAVTPSDVVVADYLGQVWGGAVFDSSYDSGAPLVRALSELVPGWANSLAGKTVGSRILMSLPPSEGYGKDGNEVAGIAATDTIVFVVDLIGVFGDDAAGQADAVVDPTVAASIAPQVHGDLGGPAGLELPAGVPAPTEVVTTVLARGTGAPVHEGYLVGQYAGVDWMGNSVGSSWQSGTPEVFPISVDTPTFAGLIGVPLGSRVLLQEPATAASPAVAVVVDLVAQP